MSDYTKSTNFASKDSLASGNPLKIVKGTEIDTEFNNIATAISTKADLASPTLTGTPAAPTATAGTNTTQLATTAFVTTAVANASSMASSTYAPLASPALTGTPTAPTASPGTSTTQVATTAFVSTAVSNALAAAYPVGSVYMNATNSTNPATLLGFGTWVALGAGRMLVGFSSGDPLFGTAGNTGGSRDATLPSHSHSITDPGHVHTYRWFDPNNSAASLSTPYGGRPFGYVDGVSTNFGSATTGISVNTTGTSATNANLPPYLTVYMWQRTA